MKVLKLVAAFEVSNFTTDEISIMSETVCAMLRNLQYENETDVKLQDAQATKTYVYNYNENTQLNIEAEFDISKFSDKERKILSKTITNMLHRLQTKNETDVKLQDSHFTSTHIIDYITYRTEHR
jgi:hypothetical protein